LREQLEAANLKVVSWNAIELFSLCDEDAFQGMYDYTERLMQIGQEIGCDLIIAVPSFTDQSVFPEDQTIEKTVERFQKLRTLAANYSFRMGFEPLGFPNNSVRTIEQAMEILQASEEDGLPPSGLVIDTFHFFVAGQTAEDLQKIPIDRLWLVHFDDCVEKPLDELQDADRVWPGEGFFDLTGIMNALEAMNYNGFISLELFNPAYWEQEPGPTAEAAIQSLQKFVVP
jgi:2-keto-myo-inositol isomerase